ncbi:MAG TPA: site-2 protease family protein [Thermomicrobiales bacterium]|nr:site-2 protease family protein [Thermomicrobiales bacterium]
MNWSFTLFRAKGITVKIHLTFVLILIWGAYIWSDRADTAMTGALFGVVAMLLLFGAVTLHEFAHSFQALRFGVRVRDITLLPIGGVARMESIPEQPRQELQIAIVGPLTNLLVAALLVAFGGVLSLFGVIHMGDLINALGKTTWTGLLAYLTAANLLLAVFNLIPAFPMDGGRVLRALLAMRFPYPRATKIAVAVGQSLALLLGIGGITSGSYSLILIAVFVWFGAGQEGKLVEIKGTFGDATVAYAMTRHPQTLERDATLAQATDLLLSTSETAFPIVSADGSFVGLLTQNDLLKGLRAHQPAAPVHPVTRIDIPTTTPGESLIAAQQRMTAARTHALAVVDERGALVGLLTSEGINEAYRVLSANPALVIGANGQDVPQSHPQPAVAG